jgi:hypothetical protein
MATNYPTALDSFTPHPQPTDPRNNPSLAGKITNLEDAMEAVQETVGITGSADPASLEYRVDALEATDSGVYGYLRWPPFGASGTTATTSYNFAWKGVQFTPTTDLEVYGLTAWYTPVTSSVIRAGIITVSGGTVATITKTTETYTSPDASSARVDLLFVTPVPLVSGTTYGLIAGYATTAGGVYATTNFAPVTTPIAAWQGLLARLGTISSTAYHIASLDPVVTTAVTSQAAAQSSGNNMYNIALIYRPA